MQNKTKELLLSFRSQNIANQLTMVYHNGNIDRAVNGYQIFGVHQRLLQNDAMYNIFPKNIE